MNKQNNNAYAISFFNDGSFVTVWGKKDPTSYQYDIYAQKYTSDNVVSGEKFKVTRGINSKEFYLTANTSPDGSFIILWVNSNNSYSYNLFCQKYSKDGEKIGKINKVNDIVGNINKNPSVLMNQDGSYIIAWHDLCKYGYDQCVYYQKFTIDSLNIASNQYIKWSEKQQIQSNIKISKVNDKQLLATWDQINNKGIRSIFVKLIGVDNNSLDYIFEITSENNVDRSFPNIAIVSDQKVIIAWEQINNDGLKSLFGKFLNILHYEQSASFAIESTDNVENGSLKLLVLDKGKILISYIVENEIRKYHADIICDDYNYFNTTIVIEKEITSSSIDINKLPNTKFTLSIPKKINQDWEAQIIKYDNTDKIESHKISTRDNSPPKTESFEQVMTKAGYLNFQEHAYDLENELGDLMVFIISLPKKGWIKFEEDVVKVGHPYPINKLSYLSDSCNASYYDSVQFLVSDTMNARSMVETLYIKINKFPCPPIANSVYKTITDGHVSLECLLEEIAADKEQKVLFVALPKNGNFIINDTIILQDTHYSISEIEYHARLEGCSSIYSDYASYKIYDTSSEQYSNVANIFILVDKFHCPTAAKLFAITHIAKSFAINIMRFGEIDFYNHLDTWEDHINKLKIKFVELPIGEIKIDKKAVLKDQLYPIESIVEYYSKCPASYSDSLKYQLIDSVHSESNIADVNITALEYDCLNDSYDYLPVAIATSSIFLSLFIGYSCYKWLHDSSDPFSKPCTDHLAFDNAV